MKNPSAQLGKILIADDDETFLNSTVELLEREGYDCDCALTASIANEMLSSAAFDLVITDLQIPGNSDLELIENLKNKVRGMPVILVTGFPSLESAIRSIQLPVFAYLLKPIDHTQLLTMVRAAIERFRDYRALLNTQNIEQDWHESLKQFDGLFNELPGDASFVPINTFVYLTLRNIFGNLSDLKQLTDALERRKVTDDACHLMNCPRPKIYLQALTETIEVLRKTKNSFKSKELGALRMKLEKLVKESMNYDWINC